MGEHMQGKGVRKEVGTWTYCHSNAFPLRCRLRIQLVHHIDCPCVVRGQWEPPLRGRGEIQRVLTAISSPVVGAVTSLGHHCATVDECVLLSSFSLFSECDVFAVRCW